MRRELEWWVEAMPAAAGVAFFPADGVRDIAHHEYFFDASTSFGCGGAMIVGDVCYYFQHKWRDVEPWHINVGEAFAGFASLSLFSAVDATVRGYLEYGDNKVANASARRSSSPNRRIAEVLRQRGLFIARTTLATQQVYVNTLENKMADPLSRGDELDYIKAFKRAARARGARSFVKLELDASLLALEMRVNEIGRDGAAEPSTRLEERVSQRLPPSDDDTEAVGGDHDSVSAADERRDVTLMSGFAGLDSAAVAMRALGGTIVAAFDIDTSVRRVHDRIHGQRCWGDFYKVWRMARTGRISGTVKTALVYVAGTPCPDWSKAGLRRGQTGTAGGKLWLHNIAFAIAVMFPVVILEQVTGIFDVDSGAFFWEALARLRDVGYLVAWRVRRCQRWGDGTSRRRVFVVAALPGVLREGVGVDDLFLPEPGPTSVGLVQFADATHDPELVYKGPVTWCDRRQIDPDYDGPILLGVAGSGGIGHHVYDATGPVVTQKTWGQGPGAATGLYKFADGTIRRLSTTESLRAHSFPETLIEELGGMGLGDDTIQRLAGNSIPVKTLQAVISHVVSLLDPAQIRR